MLEVETLSEASVTQQVNGRLRVETEGQGFTEITEAVSRWVFGTGVLNGLLTIFCRHTSASLLIQENAAPAARRDLEAYFARVAPESKGYEHDEEGSDDMPAHVKASLLGPSLTLPVRDGAFAVGTWQGIYLCEHRDSGGPRRLVVTAFGEGGS